MTRKKDFSAPHNFLYRIEVFISLNDEQGQPVELRKIRKIADEIINKFGGLTMTTLTGNPIYDGFWRSPASGKIAQDKNSIFTILAPQTDDTINFFTKQKEKWRKDLNYEAILITLQQLQIL